MISGLRDSYRVNTRCSKENSMFSDLRDAVQKQFVTMKSGHLFKTEVNKDEMWETYLESFPDGTNPTYKERTEHDCQCCKHFIRAMGNVVTIKNREFVSIWDVDNILISTRYQVVAAAMSKLVKSAPIRNIYLTTEKKAGTFENFQKTDEGVLKWDHFCLKVPERCVVEDKDIGKRLSEAKSTKDVFLRGLTEITVDALETVLELIAQNSLYKGEENHHAVATFLDHKRAFDNLDTTDWPTQHNYSWACQGLMSPVQRIRNTSIGILLTDISEGVELDKAVASFESKVAPTNYKRPKALVTKAMIKRAQETVKELGFETALGRRFAVPKDVTVNNVLFANRDAKQVMGGVFEEMLREAPVPAKSLDKVEELSIKDLVKILPGTTSIQLMLENRISGNLMSLVAPADADSKSMLKWSNNFTWDYNGGVADSIKTRVKLAGGNVEGDLRCSLSWFNTDDLDFHIVDPYARRIYFNRKRCRETGGHLDVDMNVNSPLVRDAVENICYPDRERMQEGTYKLSVHNYMHRESIDVGFEVELEFDGVVHTFAYGREVKNKESVAVAIFSYSHQNGLKILESLPMSQASKTLWGIGTQQFHEVSMVMLSPNHWDDQGVGNRHYFFMLQDCINEGPARGFYNEFLSDSLREHRKVFELLGSKMQTPESSNQLSGLGFSSTQHNHVFAKVTGNFTRTIKITF